MRTDTLKKFVSLRDSLASEKAELEARLSQINEALALSPSGSSRSSAAPAVVSAKSSASAGGGGGSAGPRRRRGRGRASNQLSLREAVMQVTKSKPMSRQEILEGVKRLGYKFAAKDPLNSLSTLLYTTKGIKNFGGKFGPA